MWASDAGADFVTSDAGAERRGEEMYDAAAKLFQSHRAIGGSGRGVITANSPFGRLGIVDQIDAMGPIMIPGAEACKAAYHCEFSKAQAR